MRERCTGSEILVGYIPGFPSSPDWVFPGSYVECKACGGAVKTYSDGVTVRVDVHLEAPASRDLYQELADAGWSHDEISEHYA